MSKLNQWIEAALTVANAEGMADDQVIPTWPKECADTGLYPELTVGALREWQKSEPCSHDAEPAGDVCRWSTDCDGSMWEGECGIVYEFFDGGPSDNQQNFCPGCGKRCVEIALEDYEEGAGANTQEREGA